MERMGVGHRIADAAARCPRPAAWLHPAQRLRGAVYRQSVARASPLVQASTTVDPSVTYQDPAAANDNPGVNADVYRNGYHSSSPSNSNPGDAYSGGGVSQQQQQQQPFTDESLKVRPDEGPFGYPSERTRSLYPPRALLYQTPDLILLQNVTNASPNDIRLRIGRSTQNS
ncbi:hypothetical protein B0H13DRAFT_2301456 [Mycena leptocephala]|nr:hypothetical protein B0H13DRAFT_2301456 [Mycena leptocephala]